MTMIDASPDSPAMRLDSSGLPQHLSELRRPGARRLAADPIGMGGLPDDRAALDAMLRDLCCRLWAADGRCVPGRGLAEAMQLSNTRSLRLLVAYGHIRHRLRDIVGLPGGGYCWGPGRHAGPMAYHRAAGTARQMGRDHLALATLYGRGSSAMEIAQLCLDFPQSGGRNDLLGAMLTADGVGIGDLLDAMIGVVRGRKDGPRVLAELADRHRDVLLSADTVNGIREHLLQAVTTLDRAFQTTPAIPKCAESPSSTPLSLPPSKPTTAYLDSPQNSP